MPGRRRRRAPPARTTRSGGSAGAVSSVIASSSITRPSPPSAGSAPCSLRRRDRADERAQRDVDEVDVGHRQRDLARRSRRRRPAGGRRGPRAPPPAPRSRLRLTRAPGRRSTAGTARRARSARRAARWRCSSSATSSRRSPAWSRSDEVGAVEDHLALVARQLAVLGRAHARVDGALLQAGVDVLGELGGAAVDDLAQLALLAPQQHVGGAAARLAGLRARGSRSAASSRSRSSEHLHRPLLRGRAAPRAPRSSARRAGPRACAGRRPRRRRSCTAAAARPSPARARARSRLVRARDALEPREVVEVPPQRLLAELGQRHPAAQQPRARRRATHSSSPSGAPRTPPPVSAASSRATQ